MFRYGWGSNPGDGTLEERGLSQDDTHTGDPHIDDPLDLIGITYQHVGLNIMYPIMYFLTSEPNEHVFAARNLAGCRLNLIMILSLKVPLKVSTRMKQWNSHLNLSASWIERLCNCLLMQDEFINSLSDYKLPFRCNLWILVKPDAPTKAIANSFRVSEFLNWNSTAESVLIKMLL